MIFHFFVSYIYIQISRGVVQACVIQLQVLDWMKVWTKMDYIPYPIISRLYPPVLHKRASFHPISFKQQTNLISSYSPFKKLNLLGQLDFIFQIYYSKADIFLDLNIQDLHAQIQFHLRKRFKSFLFKNQIQQ